MIEDGGEFARQAAICGGMGAGFTARVLEAAGTSLGRALGLARMVEGWPGRRDAAAVALRLGGGLHALARRGTDPALAAVYRALDGDVERVIGDALATHDAWLCEWMCTPPQTNEVARAAAIMAALLVVAERFAMPVALLELGSSAGLLLRLAHYRYALGGVGTGDPASRLLLAPDWRGPPPLHGRVEVASACGVDLDPLDVTDAETRERLAAYVWPEQPERLARLEAAIGVALAHPARIDRADGAGWLAERLAGPQRQGECRVVFHSVALQYFAPASREQVCWAIEVAGERATAERPLAWISFEWDEARGAVALRLRTWPGEGMRELATCHAHAAWLAWA